MRAEERASALFAGKVAAEEVRLARAALGRGGADAGAGARAPRDGHLDVVAPVSGRVLRVFQKSAGVVPAGTPLVEIGDPAALEIVVDVLTTVAVQVRPGTPVAIQGWGGDAPLGGRVRLIEPSGFTRPSALGVDEQRVNVVIALTDPRDRWAALGDGYRVEARLVLWQAGDVLKAPQGAVFRQGDGWGAFRIDGGKATLVPVEIGHRGETDVEILSGLTANAVVAVHPGDRVKSGARVETR
jgi:HlyD family secretion protein